MLRESLRRKRDESLLSPQLSHKRVEEPPLVPSIVWPLGHTFRDQILEVSLYFCLHRVWHLVRLDVAAEKIDHAFADQIDIRCGMGWSLFLYFRCTEMFSEHFELISCFCRGYCLPRPVNDEHVVIAPSHQKVRRFNVAVDDTEVVGVSDC